MSLIIIGFMGVGKTSLARALDEAYLDTDQIITKQTEMSIANYFATYGEGLFRKKEETLLHDLLASPFCRPAVLSTGGGIVLSASNRALIKKQKQVLYLAADFDSIVARLKKANRLEPNQRPLFQENQLAQLKLNYNQRLPLYQGLATVTIDSSQLSIAEIVRQTKISFHME
jgi:shikimate kinase